MSHVPESDVLLHHAGFLRGLVRGLLARDESAVDDVVQETYRAALERPPRQGTLRAWLATVARNAARMRLRARSRRHAREHVRAREDAAPSTAEMAARLELQRKLVDAVATLDEPLRSTLVLRFYDDRKPGDIARRLGVTTKTVRVRLDKALAILRRALDRDGRTWRGVLAPLATTGLAGWSAAAIKGGLFMGAKAKLGVAGVLVLVCALLIWQVADSSSGDAGADARAERNRSATPAAGTAPDEVADDVGATVERSAEAGPLPAWRVVGTVTDGRGAVAGAEVAVEMHQGDLHDRIATVSTDAEGRYIADLGSLRSLSRLRLGAGELNVRGLAARHLPGSWKTVEGELRHDKATVVLELDLELEAGATLRGRVVTSGGAPVAGADVKLERKGMRRSTETDADGTYIIGIDKDANYELAAEGVGHGTASRTLMLGPSEDAETESLVLRGPRTLRGIVVDSRGAPHPDLDFQAVLMDSKAAPPGLERTRGRTDAEGRFELAGLREGPYRISLSSFLAPKRPAGMLVTAFDVAADATEARLVVDLVRIRVRIRDGDGDPLPGAYLGTRGWSPKRSPDVAQFLKGLVPDPPPAFASPNVRSAGFESQVDAATSWLAPRGSVWVITASIGRSAPVERVVHLTGSARKVDVDLPLALPGPTGRLKLVLIDEKGNEVGDYWAKLQSLETRTTLHAWAKRRDQVDRFSPPAPLGRYRLRIEPGLRPASAFREVVQDVVIVANDAVLRVTLASAGLFRFRVRVEGKEDGSTLGGGPRLHLGSQDGKVQRSATWFERLTEDGGHLSFGGLKVGLDYYAFGLIEPGVYDLRLECKGFRAAKKTVVVRQGAPDIVTFQLAKE